MRLSVTLLFLLSFAVARADVSLPPIFGDRLVLQRDRPVPVWGRAEPGEKVTVAFEGQEVSATTPADGRWIVYLEPLAVRSTAAEMTVTGRNQIVIRDVLVGEVWLCSGQSNMEWPVDKSDRAQEEIAAAKFPLIREFRLKRTVAALPTDAMEGAWKTTSPETVGSFTAVGYFFARDLHRKLGIPVAIINSSWGGTQIEAWMSPAALNSNPAFSVVNERWQKTLADFPANRAAHEQSLAAWTAEEAAAKAAGQPFAKRRPSSPTGPGSPQTPTGLFNGMINPVLPFALRGALWYQGESNASRAAEYHDLFAAMITYWRAHFGQGDFPFYWVQLANFKANDPNGEWWPRLREAQSRTLALPDTGQAVTIDIGEVEDIHPRNKQEVGRRLALIAKSQVYRIAGDFSGPVFASATREKSALRVRFLHAEGGLIAREKPAQSFEVAGADRTFFPARVTIHGDTLLASAPEVKEPVAVRYAWRNAPEANLYNGAGLPASPFRSDSW